MLKNNIPVFTEDKSKEIVSDESLPYNFLLEGDNLHSLKLLEKTHKGKIDIIYIDPPYNLGNKDFIYDDNYVDKDDSYRHSKWISFIYERLKIAKILLKDDGLIFISIDDTEYSNLKLLLDEIFGEANYFTTISLEISKTQGMKVRSAQNGTIVKNHEFVLVYTQNKDYATLNRNLLFDKAEPYDNHFNCIITENAYGEYSINSLNDYLKTNYQDIFNLFKELQLLDKNGRLTSDNISKGIMINEKIKGFFYGEFSEHVYQQMNCTIEVPTEIQNKLNSGRIVKYDKYILQLSSGGKLRQYRNLRENLHITDDYYSEFYRATIRGNLWKGFYSDMMNVQKEGDVSFKNSKKPVRLIKQIIKYCNRPNGIILDFFAGSGTTAESVLELNKEDTGIRSFILCTNNENRICETITYKRIKTVISGLKSDSTKYSDGIPANLKYFKTDFVPKDSDNIQDVLLEHVAEMIELENGIKLDGKRYIMILDDEQADNLSSHWNEYSDVKALYVARDVLFNTEQNMLFKDIEIHTIPDYYFNFELREAGELW